MIEAPNKEENRIIPVLLDLTETNTNKNGTLNTNSVFWTTDINSAYLEFITTTDLSYATASLVLKNTSDGSEVQRNIEMNQSPFYYMLSDEEIERAGNWIGQIVVEKEDKALTSKSFKFTIKGSLLDTAEPALSDIENYQKFYKQLNDLEVEMSAKLGEFSEGLADLETMINDDVVEAKFAEKLTDLETQYAPRLTEVTAQLAQNKKQKQVYGEVRLPENFPLTLDFNLFRKSDGIIYHDINVKNFKIGTKIYVSMVGTSVSDGLTPDTPTRSISDVSRIINGIEDENIIIVFLDHFFRATFWENALINLNKNLYFTSGLDSGTTIINGSINMDWTLDNNLLKANRTQAQEVFYSDYRDEFNRPKPFKKVSSITESQSSLFSYYTDGVSVWVNIPDKKTGTRDDLNVLLSLANSFTIQTSNKRVVFDNLNFYMKHPSTAKSDGVRVNGTQDSTFYSINSSFRYAGLNGIGSQSVGKVYVLNSVATDNSVDGFNYHGSHNNFVFEYNSTGFDNGTPSENSANVTTAHDGLTILRVGSIGYRCYGPLLADVNGCYSVNIDCRMYETLNSANSFWFSDSGGTKLTEAYLINCEGGSGDTVAIGSNISNPVNVYNMPELTKTSRTIIKEITLV